MRQCVRCGAGTPLHKYPVGGGIKTLCTRCWEDITKRKWNWQPPINPSQKLIPGLPGVQPRLI